MSNAILERTSDRIRTTPQGAINTRRGLTVQIDSTDWRAVMDSTQDTSNSFRSPSRWNSVPVPERVAQRAITNCDKREDGCWISRYSVASHGYAQIGWQDGSHRHMVLAHRASWVAVNGQVPLGMTIDHLCKHRRCVNPDHLRLLPNYENARRTAGRDWPMGYCVHGHDATHLVAVTRSANASGKAIICGECLKVSRQRWVDKHREWVRPPRKTTKPSTKTPEA